MRDVNQAGIDLIKRFEGCRLTAYPVIERRGTTLLNRIRRKLRPWVQANAIISVVYGAFVGSVISFSTAMIYLHGI